MPTPLPVIANVYRCTLNWEGPSGMHAANVLHLQAAASTAASVYADLDANVTRDMWNIVSQLFFVTSVDIIPLDGTSGTVSFATGSPAKWNGNGASGDYTIVESVIVKFTTGVRGRDNRGRLYLPFPSEAQISDGSAVSVNLATMQSGWNAWLAAMTSAATLPVVAAYDRRYGGAGAHATVINSILLESLLGTQRKRQQRLRR